MRDNVQLVTMRTQTGLFCVQRTNLPGAHRFAVPRVVDNTSSFSALAVEGNDGVPTFGDAAAQVPTSLSNGSYVYGNAVLAIYDTTKVGVLSAPAPGTAGSSLCDDGNPLQFLVNTEATCTRPSPASMSTGCTSLDGTWLNTLAVAATGAENAERHDVVVTVQDADMTDTNGGATMSESSIVEPASDTGNSSCRNALLGVAYTFTFAGNGSITSAKAVVKLGTVSTMMSVAQTTSATFITAPTTSTTASSGTSSSTSAGTAGGAEPNSYPRSGNPGYVLGKPLVAGTWDEVAKMVKLAGTDPNTWLRMPAVAAPGGSECIASSSGSGSVAATSSITFGDNAVRGCTLDLSGVASCDRVRLLAEQALRPPAARLIGRFGNASQTAVDDWVTILGLPLDLAAVDPGLDTVTRCQGVLTGATLTVITASVGSLERPQRSVVGARWSFTTETVTRVCAGASCTPKVALRTAVSFVDVTQPAVPEVKALPSATVSSDFFYPIG